MSDRQRRLMQWVTVLSMLSIWVAFSREADAHAELVGSNPAAGSAELAAPGRIELEFSEQVDPALSSIALLDTNGNPIVLDSVTVAPDDHQVLQAELANQDSVPAGVFTVVWGAYSVEDGHASSGSFTFSVGTGQAPEQTGQRGGDVLVWSVVGKWLELISLVILTGLAAFGLSGGAVDTLGRNSASRSFNVLAAIGLAGAAISLRARENAVSGGSFLGGVRFGTLTDLLSTPYGRAWTVRVLALLVVSIGALLLRRRQQRSILAILGIAGFIGLGTIAVSGHAETVDPSWLGALVDVLHMSAAAIWVGGLLGLLLVLEPACGSPHDRSLLQRQGNRFAAAIVLIVLAGFASAYWHIGGRRSLQQTDYGRTLLIKIAIVVGILGIAYYNRRVLQGERGRMRWVPLAIGAELVLATIVLLFSANLSQTPPGNRPLDVQVAARAIDLTDQVTAGATTISLSGVLTGDPTDIVTIGVSPDTDLQRVIVESSLVTEDGATVGDRFDALPVEASPGQFEFPAGRLGIAGPWTLDLTVRRAGVEDEVTTTIVDTSGLATYGVRSAQDSWGGFRITSHTALALVLTAVMLVIGLGGLRRITGLEPLASGFLLAASLLIAGGFLVSAARGLVPVTPDHARENPLDTSPGALTYAGELYRLNCAICHGAGGQGAGASNLAHLHGNSADLTSGGTEQQSDGDLRYWIANGVPGTRMPAFDQALTEDEQWQLVMLIRQLQQEAKDAGEIE